MKKLINWLKSLFSSAPGPKKPKTFTFGVRTTQQVIEEYTYEIEADSEKEAFRKLVKMFYGDFSNEGIKSEHRTGVGVCTLSTNMPRWYARISGGESEPGDREKLAKYAEENNIKLRIP